LAKRVQLTKNSLISIVDDDQSMVESIVSLIQSVGYKAKGFYSADDFLKSSQLFKTSCLILDVCMPEIDGLELQRRLAATTHRIPIIFITAYDSDDLRARAFEAGAAGFLFKPFSEESLLQAVRSAVGEQSGET
jgi:FixJ family two-component response regulator